MRSGPLWLVATTVFAAALSMNGSASARPQYAAREGMYCTSCHLDPAGGGMRHGNGFAYARGRHAWEVEPKFEEWKIDPEITKGVRVGGDIRYVGIGQSTGEHYDDNGDADSTDPLFANFAMQGSVYLALNPVEPIVLYYNHDLGASQEKSRDWWGMVRNLTDLNIYVKAGQIRPAYGVRLDDHTPFVRGFRAPVPGEVGIMDVDPRLTYPGVEAGFVKNGVFLHAGYADQGGTSSPNFTKLKEKMVSARAGVQQGHLQVGGSVRTNGRGDGDEDTRSSRYGLFALFGGRSFALVAEADAGTDESGSPSPDLGVRAGYLQGELYLSRGVTARADINYMDVENDETGALPIVSRRFGIGLEWNPIPFLRLAGEGRYVSNSSADRSSLDETWGLGYAVVSF